MPRYDVVICGAGVGGLALAVGLGRLGRSVLLVEQHRRESHLHKGEFLQPRSLQILDEWGILPTLHQRGAVRAETAETRAADGEFLGELDYRLLPSTFNYGLIQYYHELKGVLEERAAGLVTIKRGTRVADLICAADGRVTGVRLRARDDDGQDVAAALVVGADGRMSMVRRRLGVDPGIREYDHEMMSLDLRCQVPPRVVAYLTSGGLRALYPLPGHRARLYVQIRRGEFGAIKRQDFSEWRDRLLATAPGLAHLRAAFPLDLREAQVQRAWRYCSPIWARPGAALLGDAAHAVHPSAGQGMNMAVVDAWTLSQTIGAMGDIGPDPDAIDEAVAAYERRRLQEFEHIARICNRMAIFCTSTSPFVRRLATHMGRRNRGNRRLQHMICYNVSGLGVARFNLRDRAYQLGILRDPQAARRPERPISVAS